MPVGLIVSVVLGAISGEVSIDRAKRRAVCRWRRRRRKEDGRRLEVLEQIRDGQRTPLMRVVAGSQLAEPVVPEERPPVDVDHGQAPRAARRRRFDVVLVFHGVYLRGAVPLKWAPSHRGPLEGDPSRNRRRARGEGRFDERGRPSPERWEGATAAHRTRRTPGHPTASERLCSAPRRAHVYSAPSAVSRTAASACSRRAMAASRSRPRRRWRDFQAPLGSLMRRSRTTARGSAAAAALVDPQRCAQLTRAEGARRSVVRRIRRRLWPWSGCELHLVHLVEPLLRGASLR